MSQQLHWSIRLTYAKQVQTSQAAKDTFIQLMGEATGLPDEVLFESQPHVWIVDFTLAGGEEMDIKFALADGVDTFQQAWNEASGSLATILKMEIGSQEFKV